VPTFPGFDNNGGFIYKFHDQPFAQCA